MSNLTDPHHTRKPPGAVRVFAAVVGLMLVFASVAPPFALAEADSEGEGSTPPGALPGLEEAEPGGGETPLEELPPASGEPEAEEVSGPEAEGMSPAPEAEEVSPGPEAGGTLPAPAPESSAPPAVEPGSSPEVAEPTIPPPALAPVYGTEESAPSYQPESSPSPPAVVRNEAIVAPEAQRPEARAPGVAAPRTAPVGEGTESPSEPVEVPEPVVSSQAVLPPTPADPSRDLKGRRSYTVAPGDCLWSIATALLRPGASSAKIEVEVAHLWRMNVARIGTGDPNLVLVGTVLRLR